MLSETTVSGIPLVATLAFGYLLPDTLSVILVIQRSPFSVPWMEYLVKFCVLLLKTLTQYFTWLWQNVFRYYCTVWTFVQSVLLTIVHLILCRLGCLWNSSKLVQQIDVINECCEMFNVRSVSSLILKRKQNFLTKVLEIRSNFICVAVSGLAQSQLNSLLSSSLL